ncbi:ribonuclease P protein component [Desertibacillus haloalkaliphilus]|uniref:ribonuclease P protein component n=1 Tax=Desertibacillus haloalkaliphilus TaxID=1328930 RepID=UPI001C26294F|nr:ribonuclease P protein component [Desertibacillus haloalkaliphilus]MBU8905759.1 ribonuclease P protein component [Desertibacillus haloalkaliphilus]
MKKEYRIKKNDDFSLVFKHGTSVANRQFVLYVLNKKEQDHFRLGLSVSKRIGNAVTRVRVKRLIREVFRELEDDIISSNDYVVIARKPTADMDFWEVKKSLTHVFKRAKVYIKS